MTTFKTETGFSIEIIGFQYEDRGTYKGLPLYESIGGTVTAIAIVDKPAIESGTVVNLEKKLMTGPIMIPDKKMFRNPFSMVPIRHYVYFSAETIKKLQKEFKGEIKIGH